MPVAIDIEYQGDLHCAAVHVPSSTTISTEAPLDNGGKGEAFSPTDLVAAALGACVLTIMGIVAKRQNIDLRGARAHVEKEMASQPVRRIGKLTVVIAPPDGLTLSDDDRKRLKNGAKTCPVKQSLHPDVEIDLRFEYA
jgi:putative redox protein